MHSSKMGSLLALMIGAAMATSSSDARGSNDGSYGHGIPHKPKKIIPKGCKEFTFFGITVHALSEDRALTKIRKIREKGGRNGL